MKRGDWEVAKVRSFLEHLVGESLGRYRSPGLPEKFTPGMKGLVACEVDFGHQARSVGVAVPCRSTQNSVTPLPS